MPEAHAHDAHAARLERAPREFDETQDPRVIVKGRVARPCEQQGVDVVEVRIRVQVVDDVVAGDGDGQVVDGGRGRSKSARRGVEECGEDTGVVAVAGTGLGLWRVALEDGESEGCGGAHGRRCGSFRVKVAVNDAPQGGLEGEEDREGSGPLLVVGRKLDGEFGGLGVKEVKNRALAVVGQSGPIAAGAGQGQTK